MPISLTPLLAVAAAMLTWLITQQPIISLFVGILFWRALMHLIRAGNLQQQSPQVRNPLRSATTSGAATVTAVANPRKVSTSDGKRRNNIIVNNEPPMITDLFKAGRELLQGNANNDSVDTDEADDFQRRRSDDDDYQRNIQTGNENGGVVRKKWLPTSETGTDIDEMHSTPMYMTKLAELDHRISLGEISDDEYDQLYDRILRSAGR